VSEDRSSIREAALQKARRALRTARLSLDDGDGDGAINRAYYAAFYTASAALELAGETPRTHRGTQARFWTRFVETGRFPSDLGGVLSHAQAQREKADYDAMIQFDIEAAADLVKDMEAFVEEAERLLQELAKEEKE
jgi:uncharacterized protein (UPF0332 family)